ARISSRLQVEQILEKSLPTVNVDSMFEDLPGVGTVVTDEVERARMALSHLLDRGFTQFAYFAPPDRRYSHDRGDAFLTEVEMAGYTHWDYRPGYRAGRKISWDEQQRRVSRWLASLPKPIAVLAVDAQRARQLTEICFVSKVRVPDDVAILAGESNELMCDVSTPPLSSILEASQRIGHDSAELLNRIMDGEAPPNSPIRIPPIGVIGRQSTDILSIDDENIVNALRLIQSRATQGLVVDDILYEVPVSRRSLEIRFRRYLGRSPAEEIRRVRLEKSKDLLARSEMSIAEVASACGFANATRFGVAFRKRHGMTPLAYRKTFKTG
ncbi:MAG: substrate-binding domain-containing protein, partial [Planctomycetales bacterium]|nr:substrate-binding domain-containing protein [Planctomycetales bacterium]